MSEQTLTTTPPQCRFLNREEAAAYLGVSVRWLASRDGGYNLVPRLKFGRQVRYDRFELDRWASQQRD